MVFSSPTFLFIFLPAVYLLNTLLRSIRARNMLLLVASLLFYAWGEPVFVLVMLGSCLANYLLALGIGGEGRNKPLMILAVVLNIGMLCAFKYLNFIVQTINDLLGLGIELEPIRLPIGISFFTFQVLSYVLDVYLGRAQVQTKFLHVVLYVSFFPQLIAGPIVKYHDVALQLDNRSTTAERTAKGMQRFVFGLSKKMLLANTLSVAVDGIYSTDLALIPPAAAWLAALAYAGQIYFDFSGYSDMAIGLGHIFGFEFKENFNYPYFATSMQDFWRRWHISLSTWFKEYVYIPLGGNRKGGMRTGINKILVFFLTGLWHGASWTFVAWGLYHGAFLMLESQGIIRPKGMGVFGRVYTVLVAVAGFVLFRAESFGQAFGMLGRMIGLGSYAGAAPVGYWLTPVVGLALVAGFIASTPVTERLRSLPHSRYMAMAISLLLLLANMLMLSSDTYNPFIYFRF